ncbi:TetR/AcrR family transcriptional regulator [Nocardia halotolerans]|uniref:TetR/AcrR family transcriptional regulator n=1 Tax=Nocardia halotolerans TaxID=1755878 RepID=A0ABV8VEX0_9NOCA
MTTEDIAAAAGIGHSTYFRYVTSKDDLLLGALRRAGAAIFDSLRARPADEAPEAALCQASLRWSSLSGCGRAGGPDAPSGAPSRRRADPPRQLTARVPHRISGVPPAFVSSMVRQ